MRRPVAAALATAALLGAAPAALAQARAVVVGQTQTDSLTLRDPLTRRRQAPYHMWTLDGRRGQRLVIDMQSTEFDAYLVLRDPEGFTLASDDDAGEGNNARVRVVLPRDGRYRVVATAFTAESHGAYQLAVTPWSVPQAPAPGATGVIRVGDVKDGTLEPGDSVGGDGPFEDRWTVEATAGQRLRFELRSTDFDAYLSVLGPDGRALASDDDGLGNRDAVVAVRARSAGRYTVVASTFGDDPVSGAYQLSMMDESGEYAEPGAAAALTPGAAREGRLESGDPEGSRGYEDRWTFSGRAGQVMRLDVVSTQFDPYVVLRLDGMAVDSNDDGGDGTNARLQFVLPSSGSYTAVVSSYSENRSGGRYSVALNIAAAPAGPGQTARLSVGQQLAGRLEEGDRRREAGGYEDYWEFDGRAGQQVSIEMRSGAFDAYLELRDPRGDVIAQDDDGLGGTDSYILAGLPSAGRYRVIARRYGEDVATGMYDITMTLAAAPAPPARVGELRAAETVIGRLEPGDSLMGDSTYADIFTFRADRGGEIAIDLHSGDFDTYLLLQDARGQTLASDDDGGSGTDSRLTARVVAGQTYRVIANSFGEERHAGSYRIVLRWQ